MKNDESSCQRVQNQARLNYAECRRTYVILNYELSLRDWKLRVTNEELWNNACWKQETSITRGNQPRVYLRAI